MKKSEYEKLLVRMTKANRELTEKMDEVFALALHPHETGNEIIARLPDHPAVKNLDERRRAYWDCEYEFSRIYGPDVPAYMFDTYLRRDSGFYGEIK